MKRIFISLIFMFAAVSFACALPTAQAAQASGKPKEVGNKVCPVCKDEIVKGEEIKYKYKGKVYNFACSPCIKEFNKAPEKYISKLEKTEEPEEAQGQEMGMHEHHH